MAGAALLALAGCQPASSNPTAVALSAAPSGLAQTVLTISGRGRTQRFIVEVAASPEEQQKGLMFRDALAPDRGMIFPLPGPEVATFWMKDTLIPLDLLFIRSDGRIANIAANAQPMDLSLILASEPVTAVLEIAGGRAAQLGISAGDRVRWRR